MTALVVAALAGALSAWLAHRRLALYHDGLRPLARQPVTGRKALQLSAPTVGRVALPATAVTGVPLVHLLLLGTDTIGLWLPAPGLAAAAGAAYGATVLALVQTLGAFLLDHPAGAAATAALGTAVQLAYPLVPGLALWRMAGWPAGASALAAPAVAAAGTVVGWWPGHWPALAALAGLAAVMAAAWRTPPLAVQPPAAPPPPPLSTRLVLAANAGLLAWLARQSLLAGDPLAAALLAGPDDRVGAAAHGLVRALSFLPTVVGNYWTGQAFATAGIPDWLFTAAYLSPTAVAALLAGAAILLAESLWLGPLGQAVLRRPSLTAAAGHLRTAVSQATDVALVLGALAGAHAAWPHGGPVLVGALVGGNEVLSRRLPRLAVAAAGLAVVLLAARLF